MNSDNASNDLWNHSSDFGQKVDLTVRIREILRNYPEGLSIIKELIQNADDAGARTIRLVTAEPRRSQITNTTNNGNNNGGALCNLMKGPSLLAYNSAKFTEIDFQSIQQIGDSLKKDKNGTKTGRFGVGVNSTYHLTDVPMFVSGTKVVLFDPQAKFVPGINPANPGKMIDFSKSNATQFVQSLPEVFEPLQVFGCQLTTGQEFDGTIFRFALRTEEQAEQSRISNQSHGLEDMRKLLQEMALASSSMLLFLKNVECIELYDWKADSPQPTLIHRTHVSNISDKLRMKRAYMLHAPTSTPRQPQPVDYILDITNDDLGKNIANMLKNERWIVCNQLGGPEATKMAQDPALSHMKLIPWGGVAARLSPPTTSSTMTGAAYCFLPLPIRTHLPVHVNGYFEISSNRRDLWCHGDDMAGDGRIRADWNMRLVSEIAAPCYCRLVQTSIRTKTVTHETYESIFPQQSLSGPWKLLAQYFYVGIRDAPVLYSECNESGNWVAPSKSILLDDDNDTVLAGILSKDRIPLVRLTNKEFKAMLMSEGACTTSTTPAVLRSYFASRQTRKYGALEESNSKLESAQYLLKKCLVDLPPTQYSQLAGCQFVPLASGNLGTFAALPKYNPTLLKELEGMGFTKLACMHALRVNEGRMDTAMEWLLQNQFKGSVDLEHGIDPYLTCDGESAILLKGNASDTFIDLETVKESTLKDFFVSYEASVTLNILRLETDMLADVVERAIPAEWRGCESSKWKSDTKESPESNHHPNIAWFTALWRFICTSTDVGRSLHSVSEKYCIVPTNEGLVCTLSPGSSVIDASNLNDDIVDAMIGLGVRTFVAGTFPKDMVIPEEIWSYIHRPSRDGVVQSIQSALRRDKSADSIFSSSCHEKDKADVRNVLFSFCANPGNGSMSEASKATLKSIPVFRQYCSTNSLDTKFVPMTNNGNYYLLDEPTEDDNLFMTSDFLGYSKPMEMKFLESLGAQKLKRSDFFVDIVVPQLNSVNDEVCNNLVERFLRDIPSLCSEDEQFRSIIMETKFIRSAESGTLKSPSELYDPEISQLISLMDTDSFPDTFYCNPQLLLILRSLGLQSTLSWEVILECARSIEQEGTGADATKASSAKERGKELLTFLDINVDTFFPEFKKKKKSSRTTKMFRKFNSVLFDDPEEKRKRKELHAQRINELLSIQWMPVHSEPLHPLLPWPDKPASVSAPNQTSTADKMWLLSYSKHLVDGDVHCIELKQLFGWLDDVSIKDVTLQLRILGKRFDEIRANKDNIENKTNIDDLCQTVTSEVGRIYHILDSVETDYEKDVIRSILHQTPWLWMGDKFILSDQIAFSSQINAMPYLFTVPPDLACFRNLLSIFSVRKSFGSSDYCFVLQRMAKENPDSKLSSNEIELAVSLVQKISDDILKIRDMEIYAPTQRHEMKLSTSLVFDDTPWLSRDLPGKKELTYAHPKLSATVAEKVGIRSVRKLLLQDNANMIDFGEGVVHEAFGQSESITRRLKNIVEMYPEGPQQLNELIQNADDAKATVVKFLASRKQHGKSSLLGQKMEEWQGPALYCYNDSKFSQSDFHNLSKIGQASKLDKLITTGRFGLGFNSVFHWTDVPSFVSGDYLCIFDPHARYVPGSTDSSRGIKIRFTQSQLKDQFPDQMKPYCIFGNDMQKPFEGSLFRFPFRNESTAADSEISKTMYEEDGIITDLFESFKSSIQRVLLFLRHVRRVEVYIEDEDDESPKLLYYAEVEDKKVVEQTASPMDNFRSLAVNRAGNVFGLSTTANEYDAISDFFLSSDSQEMNKEALYSKLVRTPESHLPRTTHLITISFRLQRRKLFNEEKNSTTESQSDIVDQYLVCAALGGGMCRAMACNPEHRDLKFLPWGSVAALLTRNGAPISQHRGNAYCFLPLPGETGFEIHINGYFELSSNRRDIWWGEDMAGTSGVRREWNRLMLSDVIAPLYCELLSKVQKFVEPGKQYDKLWPINVGSDVWNIVKKETYRVAENKPLLYTGSPGDGKWVAPKKAVLIDATDAEKDSKVSSSQSRQRIMKMLLEEDINVVSIPSSVIACMKEQCSEIQEVSPSMVREWFKKTTEHPSLQNRENATFLLRYCIDDVIEYRCIDQLHGLPLLPLVNGNLGVILRPQTKITYFVPTEFEKNLLENASAFLVDISTNDTVLNGHLKNEDFHKETNVRNLDLLSFVQLLSSHCFPSEWKGLPEVHYIPDTTVSSSPNNISWLSRLWDYILSDVDGSDRDISVFENTVPILPCLIGDEERTLSVLMTDYSAVVNVGENTKDEKLARVLRRIGIRTLDKSVLKVKDEMFQKITPYVYSSGSRGILKALSNSFVTDDNEEIQRRIKDRFENVPNDEKKVLREHLSCSDDTLEEEQIQILRCLPIYELYNKGNHIYGSLTENNFLPPSCAEPSLLNSTFIKATSRKDVEFFERMGVETVSPEQYYLSHICPQLAQRQLNDDRRDIALTRLLHHLPRLMEGGSGEEFVAKLSEQAFIPNRQGTPVKPKELYDPQEMGLADLIDDSMLPMKRLCQGGFLQSLRILGIRTQLSTEGVLESARRIEYLAKMLSIEENLEEEDILAVRKRGFALLSFLDNDNTISNLLSEILEKNESFDDQGSDDDDSETQNTSGFIDELTSICWLPVENYNSKSSRSRCEPPRVKHQLSSIGMSAPIKTRPKADEWICSSTMDILSTVLRSESLLDMFGWQQPPEVLCVASQLIDLARLEINQDYKQILSTVTSRIYEIIDSHFQTASDADQERVLILFHEAPWIWVGNRFVATTQVAFEAPENAKPYLYSVPSQMLCFETLLQSCGVRDSFSAEDYIQLLSSLSTQLQGEACDSRQLDLAIFVSRHLSRAQQNETFERKDIFLPSRDGIMFRAIDMTYDDAPWLAAIVKKNRHIFVHDDIGNEVARILGSKSLRDALSANQNGMVKIPCPKKESLSLLMSKRTIGRSGMCRVIQELLEVGEIKGAKQVSITLDRRTHGKMSILHPCLSSAQGPALVVCFHDVHMEVDEIVRSTSPAKFYSSTVSGPISCGGKGFPRFGTGFCAPFCFTDCLQVISGRSFCIFDPSGEYFIEDTTPQSNPNTQTNVDRNENVQEEIEVVEMRKGKASARNYGLSLEFCKQFPDQFEPFLSLQLGLEESMVNDRSTGSGSFHRGTILRIPFRSDENSSSSFICDRVYSQEDFDLLLEDLEHTLHKSLLFTYNLQSIVLDDRDESSCTSVLHCRLSSSPLLRMAHRDDLMNNPKWRKDKSKFGKIFKNSWEAERSSFKLEISHRHKGDDCDTVDSYIIQSILAPPRLREMANTEALGPLQLIPVVTLAAHVNRVNEGVQNNSSITEYSPPVGTIFVGMDTGIKTGLPYDINAPLFLHEWLGSVLMTQDDDAEFKATFPGIRNVMIDSKPRSLALYVWNKQALTSTLTELIPSIMREIKSQLTHGTERSFYRHWPFYERISSTYRELIDHSVYTNLAAQNMDIYLTERNGFQSIGNGCFASPDYPLGGAARFFLKHMHLFTIPKRVVQDLTQFGVEMKLLTPSVARRILRSSKHVQYLSTRPKEAIALLEYCLKDLSEEDDFTSNSTAAKICRNELGGLCIFPLSDGTVGVFGKSYVIASAEQQTMLPNIRNKFLSIHTAKKLGEYISKPGFLDVCGLTSFCPRVLADNMATVLPKSWEGKDFVPWEPGSSGQPSRLWLYQFWREISIYDYDTLQMFRRWPLIPTTTGTLASCGNVRFIICVYSKSADMSMNNALKESYKDFQTRIESENKKIECEHAAMTRLEDSNTVEGSQPDDEFWEMGKPEMIESKEEENDQKDNESVIIDEEDINSSTVSDEEPQQYVDPLTPSETEETPLAESDPPVETPQATNPSYDPSASSLKDLHEILTKISCPLLNTSYFEEEDILKTFPLDRLGLSRSILSTLNQSINYWDSNNSELNVQWADLEPDEYEQLLTHLSTHQGTRLSLMTSDLSMLKTLPLFETLSQSHISLSEREESFTLDSSVDVNTIATYLPLSLQRKLLVYKSQLKELYEDLNILCLNEATILHKFVMKEFPNMTITQKEVVVKNILEKWEIVRFSDDLINVLKETKWVKRKNTEGGIEWVQPNQLYARHDLLVFIFDQDLSCFPAEEFASSESLNVLETVGLQTNIDKDCFLKCAWIVEREQDFSKAIKLFEYFSDNFGDFFDSNQSFVRTLSEIKCVPAEVEGGSPDLFRFCDTATPKDRHLVFNILPVLHDAVQPPQVMFSSLGLVSPPPISAVLRQIKSLTEDDNNLSPWTYMYGTIEQVFSSLFSFLQDHFTDLSPRVIEGLKSRSLVPIGSHLVKVSRLFFRLSGNLAPFFYEVPRAFGAYDVLLRNLGVRESPKSGDYALSLMELKREIGDGALNANELKSVIEVVGLVADDNSSSQESMFAPSSSSKLVHIHDLLQNDRSWLIQGGRINTNEIHLVHPKLPKELCDKLQIGYMSDRVHEELENVVPRLSTEAPIINLHRVQGIIQSQTFIALLKHLAPLSQRTPYKGYNILQCQSINTRFILRRGNSEQMINRDITNKASESPFCFIDEDKIFVSQFPYGMTIELAISTALCDKCGIDRSHIAGLSAMLSSTSYEPSTLHSIQRTMNLYADHSQVEMLRGEPGQPLVPADLDLAEIKPLKMFSKGEIVAVHESDESSPLVYGVVVDCGEISSTLSRLRVCVAKGIEKDFNSSQVFTFKGGSEKRNDNQPLTNMNHQLHLNEQSNDEFETSLREEQVQDRPLAPVSKEEVLSAVQDLLQSANLSLAHDTKNMLNANLALREELNNKDFQLKEVEQKSAEIKKRFTTGMDAFLCPITREIMEDPVICCDGHTYERNAIETWLRSNSRSPKTNQALSSRELIPNHTLRIAIEAVTGDIDD